MLTLPDLDPTLDDSQLAAALVRNAGQLALAMRAEGLSGEQKTSVSDVVTAADKAAEKYITEQLLLARPSDGLLGEEGTRRNGSSGRTWVIDPVDGTYNFLSGSTYWCSAIALQAGRPDRLDPEALLGAVYQPQEDKLWLGGEGLPATLNGERLSAPSEEPLSQLSAATYLHPTWMARAEAREPWLAAVQQLATFRLLGSGSCDLSRVAQGEWGCWFQHSTALWDWLPGKAIVRAAGGSTAVVSVNGLNWFLAGGSTAVTQLGEALTVGEAT
ncbi:fructose-1,6-bisphosphatase/inositol monophosphatase family enzyme [Psychromicrobium silvestre]|uniref:Fructose-1,6-bisphosphatase/inositol monophosphatase family enzyme n=1 Tax=Psychromicrobium silvestre TaxID=1645614 RepID=A0A7Y9S8V8_9MICC|nr:inositol monophosphatase family protein [Psychromicrobium silvestre]NYE96381.1 fructose-1,6-bisphosphatase/inositol monophosphatase family enzyme [Psychromicrobium silvestre]